MDEEQLSEIIANAKNQALETIAGYIISEVEKHGFTLADLICGLGKITSDRGFDEATKLLENASQTCR